MNGKFNIDIEQMAKDLEELGKRDRELFKELWDEEYEKKIKWDEKAIENFKKAAEILRQNEKDCEQFSGRVGI